jgi:AcrR family transcriptional regulator
MARSYTKGKRADREAETRQRIVEAALALHGEIGPNATTISMIAERAGVQRHTVYAHLPDERATLMACSGLHLEREPPPSPEGWSALAPRERLRTALTALYGWFDRNERLLALVERDIETNDTLREVSELRFGPAMGAIHDSVAEGLGPKGKAALSLAMSFHTWRTLTRVALLKPKDAVGLMAHMIASGDET